MNNGRNQNWLQVGSPEQGCRLPDRPRR